MNGVVVRTLCILPALLLTSCSSKRAMNTRFSLYEGANWTYMDQYEGANWTYMDHALAPNEIPAVVTITPSEAQVLLQNADQYEIYSADSGHVANADTVVEMASLWVGESAGYGKMSKRQVQKRQPGQVEFTIQVEGFDATVRVYRKDDSFASFPAEADQAIRAIHVIGHVEYSDRGTFQLSFVEQAAKAATHPVALVVTDDAILLAQNRLRVYGAENTIDWNDDYRTVYSFKYFTYVYPVDLTLLPAEPLEDYAVVLTAEKYRGSTHPKIWKEPFVWLIPVKDGAFDGTRFGYKIGFVADEWPVPERANMVGRVRLSGSAL